MTFIAIIYYEKVICNLKYKLNLKEEFLDKNDKLLPVCPLCLREIPPGVPQSLHHLIPKLKGGKNGPTILVHHICHKEIHATLTEGELAKKFNSIETLKAHPRLSKFFDWVAKRPANFLSKVPKKRKN